jgi:long-chain acyl-CoA synthetase
LTDRTIGGLFEAQVRLAAHRPALREKRGGRWITTTWGEWSETSRAIAAALIAGGLPAGGRVALLAGTRQAWLEVDIGVLLAGGVSVPLYPTIAASQAAELLTDCQAEVLFVDDPLLLEKLIPDGGPAALGSVREIVVFDPRAVRDEPDAEGRRVIEVADVAARAPVPVIRYDHLLARGRAAIDAGRGAEVDARSAAVAADDVATLLYTSGTTGTPRGAMLTHRGFVTEVDTLAPMITLGPHDEQLLFLPMAHVFGRLLEVAQLRVGFVTSFAESVWKAMDNVSEVNPTFFASVPRLFEKFQEVANHRARSEGEVRHRLYRWAIDVGLDVSRRTREKKPVPRALALQHRYADKLVLGRLRAWFGPRLRFAISGGAPLSPSVAEWFHAIGITVLEGYGLTETSGASHVNLPERFRFGTVGRTVPHLETRLDADGEILVRGPSVMRGYWRNPAATAEVLDADGWLHTGDIGSMDADGTLTITDRKKDLIVTSNGKNVAPQMLEAMLRESPWISQAVVYGDAHKHLVALLTLDEASVVRWAREHDRSGEMRMLAGDPELRALVQSDVDGVNRRVASFETIKRFSLLDRELSVDLGELTPTMKVRRRAVYDRHRAVLEALYDPIR